MLTLHGFPFSNYHNIVKHALMQKEVQFDEHIVYPGSPELLAINPVGKVPALTTEQGLNLSESSVMVDYIEETYPENPLYPADAGARAQVRQLMKIAELYFDLPARRLMPTLFGDVQMPKETLDEVRNTLERGAKSVVALASFGPFLCGSELSLADIYLRYALAIPKLAGPAQLDWDVLESIPGLAAWDAMMADTDIARKVDADQRDNTEEFFAYVAANR